MINLHNVTAVTPGDINAHSEGRHSRVIVIKTSDHGRIELNLFADSYDALDTPSDALAHHWRTQAAEESARADAAESLADEWRNKHATLWLKGDKDRQRADSAEQRLAALQELLYKATETAGQGGKL